MVLHSTVVKILKRNDQIDKTYSRDGVIHMASSHIRDGKVIKMLPDCDLGPDVREEEHNDLLQSSYWI